MLTLLKHWTRVKFDRLHPSSLRKTNVLDTENRWVDRFACIPLSNCQSGIVNSFSFNNSFFVNLSKCIAYRGVTGNVSILSYVSFFFFFSLSRQTERDKNKFLPSFFLSLSSWRDDKSRISNRITRGDTAYRRRFLDEIRSLLISTREETIRGMGKIKETKREKREISNVKIIYVTRGESPTRDLGNTPRWCRYHAAQLWMT